MHLALRRSHYTGFWGTNYYVLDAQLEPSDPAERHLLEQHLSGLVLFDSANREAYAESVQEHLEATNEQPGWFAPATDILWATAQTAYHLGAAIVSTALGSLSLRVTVQELLDGTQVESDKYEEVNAAEKIIVESIELLRNHLQYLERFDERDDILEG